MAAAVGEAHADVVAEVLLDGHVPLLDAGVAVVDGKGVVEAGGAGVVAGGCVEGVGERDERRDTVVLIVLVVGADEAGVNGPSGDEGEAEGRLDEAAPSAADDGAIVAVGTPGEAMRGPMSEVVSVAERGGNAGLRRGENGRGRDGGEEVLRGIGKGLLVGDDDCAVDAGGSIGISSVHVGRKAAVLACVSRRGGCNS